MYKRKHIYIQKENKSWEISNIPKSAIQKKKKRKKRKKKKKKKKKNKKKKKKK